MSQLPDPPRVLPGFAAYSLVWAPRWDAYAVKIGPGDFYVAGSDVLITTTLGSCVSVCITDPVAGIGGMNHFMLPDAQSTGVVSRSARYGAFAMEELINELLHYGAERERLQVKVTGGGDMMGGAIPIGDQNAAFVRRYLKAENLSLVSEDLGGPCSRRVVYDPLSGRLFVKKVKAQWHRELVDRERRYRRKIVAQPDGGDVELF